MERLYRPSHDGNKQTTPFQMAQIRRAMIDRLARGDLREDYKVTYRLHDGKHENRKADRVDRSAIVKEVNHIRDCRLKLTLEVDVVGARDDVEPKDVRVSWSVPNRASGKLPEAIAKVIEVFCRPS